MIIINFQMESELERFHKQNTELELNITELRQKLKATEKEMHQERQRVSIDGQDDTWWSCHSGLANPVQNCVDHSPPEMVPDYRFWDKPSIRPR